MCAGQGERRGGANFTPKKGTVIPAWSSLLTEVDWATPEDQGGLTRVDDEHVVREQATCGRDVQPDVAVDKLIRACSVDPPVKYTVVRVLGCDPWPSRSMG